MSTTPALPTRRLGALLEAGQAEGSVRDDITPRNLARLTLGMINSIVDWYQPGRSGTVDQLAATVVTMVFAGLRA